MLQRNIAQLYLNHRNNKLFQQTFIVAPVVSSTPQRVD